MSMENAPLQPFETDVKEAARRRARREKVRAFRARIRRGTLEAGALLRSSAALSGLRRDGRRVGRKIRQALPSHSATLAGLQADVSGAGKALRRRGRRFADRAKRAGARTRAALLHSSTVAGLWIDAKRVSNRWKASREVRRRRASH